MNKYLYHGSEYVGIKELEPRSKLHNTDKKVLFLTDNIPYALYYIWDEEHNGYNGKHVTGWINNGIAYYEELLKYEALGKFRVLRYNDQSEMRQQELVDFIATDIVKSNFFKDNDAKAQFMRKHFVKAWERAIKQQ